jgi:transcriptional regulator with XRE-family HTH domain
MDYKIGNLLRSLLNDLKRRPEDAARELGIKNDEIHEYLSDALPFPAALIRRACEVWPVSPREFSMVLDDAPDGVKRMSAADSEASARVMERKGRPYYEYRDTAASSLSIFRPEWIKELCEVDHDDPAHPEVQWNNGHFMHQFTYFVGPVNFYYMGDDGEKKVAVMNTGDSMYIRPFVPHTFSTRSGDGGGGLILALTYGGELLGDAQQELRAVASPLVDNYALDYESPAGSTGSFVQYFLKCHSMPIEELQRRCGIEMLRLMDSLEGKRSLDFDELRQVAKALGVSVRDLLTYDEDVPSTIVVKSDEIDSWQLDTAAGSYTVRELASTPHMPMAKSLRFQIDQQNCRDHGLKVGLHQYLYNVSSQDVEIRWSIDGAEHSIVLEPDDSAFVKPFVEHCFNAEGGELISLRIPSKISGGALRELSWFGSDHVQRVANEHMPWFDKRGKS